MAMLFTLGGREVRVRSLAAGAGAVGRLLCVGYVIYIVIILVRNRLPRDIKNVMCDVINIYALVMIFA